MYSEDLALGLSLADAADGITMDRFEAADLRVTAKPDMTPVSDADVEVEKTLRKLLAEQRPADDVLGEEFGGEAHITGRQWVIDPIDATKNYVRGVPVWATLIALLEDGEPVVGVISAPALSRRWYASQGAGAWRSFNGGTPRKIAVSEVSSLADASLSFSSLSGWKKRGLLDNFLSLTDDMWRLRGFGDFFSYCLVAEGAVDVAGEPEVSLWDLAAPCILITEAGGTFTALDGTAGPHGGNVVASNGVLHQDVLQRLGGHSS